MLVFSVTLLGLFAVACAVIPDFIHLCKRTDPEIEKCIMESIEHLRPRLKDGIKELDVPALEPLFIEELTIIGRENFHALGRNVSVRGASQFELLTLKVDVPNHTYHFSTFIPRLDFDAQYEVDARILVLPIKGKGPLQAVAKDINADGVLKGKLVDREGKRYLEFVSLKIVMKIGDYSVHLENIFNGDKVLGNATNAALNENKNEFKKALKPVVEQTVSDVLLSIANRVVRKYPYDELLPEQ